MQKLKLDLDTLAVEALATSEARDEKGTVNGNLEEQPGDPTYSIDNQMTCARTPAAALYVQHLHDLRLHVPGGGRRDRLIRSPAGPEGTRSPHGTTVGASSRVDSATARTPREGALSIRRTDVRR